MKNNGQDYAPAENNFVTLTAIDETQSNSSRVAATAASQFLKLKIWLAN